MITSLMVSVRDFLRLGLTKSQDGLLFAMITIDKRFAEIKFFFSSRFWYGIWKMPRGRTCLVLLWLSASGTIATFVGPTTAVLLKPQLRYDWPAGAANYSIVGNESTIFPRPSHRKMTLVVDHSVTCPRLQMWKCHRRYTWVALGLAIQRFLQSTLNGYLA